MWRMILLLIVVMAGFWFGKTKTDSKPITVAGVDPNTEFPLAEHKSFVVVLYAHNQANWCKRALRSIFEQDYNHYRVILVDDASIDETENVAKEFILSNNQDGKVIFIKNDTHVGLIGSLYRVMDSCLDREIVIPLEAKDWLSSSNVLNRFNLAYQNPDVWYASGWGIEYPAYKMCDEGPISYYAALFKQIPLANLFKQGRFLLNSKIYLNALKALSGGRMRSLYEPLGFVNLAPPSPPEPNIEFREHSVYKPLSSFPSARRSTRADVVLISKDHPLQLYGCLESIQKYVSGFEKIAVHYETSSEEFALCYEKVKDAFPAVDFSQEPVQKALETPSEYILWCTDDLILKDFVDLNLCMEQMEKTGAFGFFLQLGRHIPFVPPSQPLSFGVYAWDMEMGDGDWVTPQSSALYKKTTLSRVKSLELAWEMPHHPIGLYFEYSKSMKVGVGLNDELLTAFNQGLKIDIDALYKIENSSPWLNLLPQLIQR